jgi:hypothetical protein
MPIQWCLRPFSTPIHRAASSAPRVYADSSSVWSACPLELHAPLHDWAMTRRCRWGPCPVVLERLACYRRAPWQCPFLVHHKGPRCLSVCLYPAQSSRTV